MDCNSVHVRKLTAGALALFLSALTLIILDRENRLRNDLSLLLTEALQSEDMEATPTLGT